MFSKILVAIDDSAASKRAFEAALPMVAALKAELLLVHALDVFSANSPERPNISMDSYSIAMQKGIVEAYQQEWNRFASHYEALLKQYQELAIKQGIEASYAQPYGRPGPAICEIARTHNTNLIIIGSRNHTYLRELVLGSVSNYVIHHAPCSVTVVHSESGKQTAQKQSSEGQSSEEQSSEEQSSELAAASH